MKDYLITGLTLISSCIIPVLLVSGLSGCSHDQKTADSDNGSEPQELFVYNQIAENFDKKWAMQPHWDDGKAEVATYTAERVVYGKVRQFEYVLITVKEDFNNQHNVKTDNYDREDLFPVMKVNQFCRIETDKYPYHYLTSVFLRREAPFTVHKLTTSSQEWCGNTFKSFTDEKKYYEFEYDSYWDKQGEGKKKIQKDVLFEDQLVYTLRSLHFKQTPVFEAAVMELQQTNKASEPHIYQALISVKQASLQNQPAWQVTVKLDKDKTNEYWFTGTYPNQLLQQTSWDGRKLTLQNLKRDAYWEHE